MIGSLGTIDAAGARHAPPGVARPASVSTTTRGAHIHLTPPRPHRPRTVCFAAPTSLPRPLREPGASGLAPEAGASLKPLPRKVEGVVDDPSLHNPLLRQERLGTGWMGVIMELEGVCVDYEYGDVGTRAWQQLADEEGKPVPFKWALLKAQGMKNEQVIQEVFCWTRNPSEVRRLAGRKEELLAELLGDRKPMVSAGVEQLLEMLRRAGAPVAIVSSAPERRVLPVLEASGLAPHFEVVVSGDDVYRGRPDPEGYLYAAQRIGRPPPRCVVLGSSNLSVEAAHEAGMACVAVAGTRPLYELTAADLVVRSVGELSFMNLKSLFSLEEGVLPHGEDGETEMEEETDEDDGGYGNNRTTVQLMEPW